MARSASASLASVFSWPNTTLLGTFHYEQDRMEVHLVGAEWVDDGGDGGYGPLASNVEVQHTLY